MTTKTTIGQFLTGEPVFVPICVDTDPEVVVGEVTSVKDGYVIVETPKYKLRSWMCDHVAFATKHEAYAYIAKSLYDRSAELQDKARTFSLAAANASAEADLSWLLFGN